MEDVRTLQTDCLHEASGGLYDVCLLAGLLVFLHSAVGPPEVDLLVVDHCVTMPSFVVVLSDRDALSDALELEILHLLPVVVIPSFLDGEFVEPLGEIKVSLADDLVVLG